MLNSAIIDIAIALSYIFFLLGLIVSTVNEVIMTMLQKRRKILQFAIRNLLYDEHWPPVAEKIFQTPFINSLTLHPSHFPSYISARNFSQALFSVIKNGHEVPGMSVAKIRELINSEDSIIKGETRVFLLTLLDDAHEDAEKFRDLVERFYDEAMERTSGWYKKSVRKWLFAIGLLIAVVLNVDTVHITRSLWLDQSLSAKTADLVQEDLKNIDVTSGSVVYVSSIGKDTLGKITKSDTIANAELNNAIKSVKNVKVTLAQTDIPMGWSGKNIPEGKTQMELNISWATKIIGWLLTAMALQLGAPFWFDLLNKIVNIRGSGNKPERSKMKAKS